MSENPLVLSLARLPRALGSTRHEDVSWIVPDDLGTPSMAVAPGSVLDVSVDMTSIDDGVLVQLATSVDLEGECVRCLDEVRRHHEVTSSEVYCEPGAPALSAQGEDETESASATRSRSKRSCATRSFRWRTRARCAGPTARDCAMCAARSGRSFRPITSTLSSIRAWPPWLPCWVILPSRSDPDGPL